MNWLKKNAFVAVGYLSLLLAASSFTIATIGFAQVAGPARPIPSTVQRINLNAVAGSASGSFTPIPAVAGQKIQIVGIVLTTASNTTVEFVSTGGSDTSLTGPMTLNGIFQQSAWGKVAGQQGDFQIPLFETQAGQGFKINTGAATQVSGQLAYTTAQ